MEEHAAARGNEGHHQDWEGLPQEVLVNVFRRINGCMSRKSARSACRRWHEAHGLSVTHVHPTCLDTAKIQRLFPFAISLDLRRRTRGEHPPGLLPALAALTGLRKLNLDSCRQSSDDTLEELAPLTRLTTLMLSHSWWIKGSGLGSLSVMTALETLGLSGCDMTYQGLAEVAALPSLTSLDLNFCWHLGDRGAELLRGATKLRSLALAGTHVRDAGAQAVSELPALTSLDMGGCEITDVGAQLLGGTTSLQSLSVQQALVTDNGLAYIAALPRLCDLNVASCPLITGSGPGLSALASHEALKQIRLKGCPLGDAGLAVLREMNENPNKVVIR